MAAGLTGLWTDKINLFGEDIASRMFYVAASGNTLFWAAEAQDFADCHVYYGTRKADGMPWAGAWLDVPKGGSQRSGRISVTQDGIALKITRLDGDDPDFDTLLQTSAGGHISAKKHPGKFARRRERFSDAGLTGRWHDADRDSSTYYIRQIGNDVFWLHEDPDHGDGFCTIFHGNSNGTTLSGTFEGIPKGDQFNGVWDMPNYRISSGTSDGSPNGDGSIQALKLVNNTPNGISPKVIVRDDRRTVLGLFLENLEVLQETDGPGTDEVYVLSVTADIANRLALPRIRTRMTEVFSATTLDNGGLTNTTLQLNAWGIAEAAGKVLNEAIPTADDVILLAALVENDMEDPIAVRTRVAEIAFGALASSLSNQDDRATIVTQLAMAIEGAIKQTDLVPFAADTFIDVDEFRFTQAQVEAARRGVYTTITHEFQGDGGKYRARFRLDRGISM